MLGCNQYNLAVAGGCEAFFIVELSFAPTRYREGVLTAPNFVTRNENKNNEPRTYRKHNLKSEILNLKSSQARRDVLRRAHSS